MNASTPVNLSIKIQKRFYHFFTPSMITIVIGLFVISYLLRERLTEGFFTAPELNFVIFLVVFSAIFKAFSNNYKLYKTMVFLRRVEKVEEMDEPAREDIILLGKKLDTEGALLNIQNMVTCLENLSVYGHLNFNDNDARLIKSKFGARMRHDRNVVNYLAGILVMLGLIGTFWGLLGTINAVGDAMGAVSESFQKTSGDEGGANIGSFIGSISAPLQGMGVAFSSSLFGLSGSLFLGFLNFFAGQAQNHAIEEVSRWIDYRIPKLSPTLKEKAAGQTVPRSDDLKAWLAGFVYLSNKTNQQMGQIMLALSKSTEAMLQSAYQTEKIYDYQKDIFMSMERMSTRMGMVKESMQYMAKNVDPNLRYQASIRDQLVEVKDYLSKSQNNSDEMSLKQLEKLGKLTNQMQEVNSTFQILSEVQSNLVIEIEKLREKSQKEDNVAEFSNLVWQLSTILEEIKQSNVSAYMSIFDKPKNAPGAAGADDNGAVS